MKILVVDDHALVCEGLCQILKGIDPDVEVLSASYCGRAFELAALHADLDLVLLDFHLPDMSGLAALTMFRKEHPELPVILLSGSVDIPMMRLIMERGASGFVAKAALSDEFLLAVRMVLAGDVYLPPQLRPRPEMTPEQAEADLTHVAPQLTPRQEDVLYLLLDGRSNKDISQTLQLSDETTKNHVSGILRVFGVQTRIQAVLAAARRGYIKSTPPP